MESIQNLDTTKAIKDKLINLVDEEIFTVEEILQTIFPSIQSMDNKLVCPLINRFVEKMSEALPEQAEHPLVFWNEALHETPAPNTSNGDAAKPKDPQEEIKARKERALERRRNGRNGLDERVKKFADSLGWEFVISKLQRRLGPKKRESGGLHTEEEIVDEAGMNEVFLGRISAEVFEDEIYDLLAEKVGSEGIIHIRVMTNSDGGSRGFAFVRLQDKESCFKVVRALNNFEIRPRYQMKVNYSPPNVRLHVSNIPKNKNKEQLKNEFQNVTEGLKDLHVHQGVEENRGFCFIDYMTHQTAKAALRKLNQRSVTIFGRNVVADWAEPFKEVDPEIMEKVRTLYVKNIGPDVTEEELKKVFSEIGEVEFVRRNVDYAFVHFADRKDALRALEKLNNAVVGRNAIAVDLARPPDAVRREGNSNKKAQKGGKSVGARRPSPPPKPRYDEPRYSRDMDYTAKPRKISGSYPPNAFDIGNSFKREAPKMEYGEERYMQRSYRPEPPMPPPMDISRRPPARPAYDEREYDNYGANYGNVQSREPVGLGAKRPQRPAYDYKESIETYQPHSMANYREPVPLMETRTPPIYDYAADNNFIPVKNRNEVYYEDTEAAWYGGGDFDAHGRHAYNNAPPVPVATRGGVSRGRGGDASRGIKRHIEQSTMPSFAPPPNPGGIKRFRGGSERGRPQTGGW